MKGNYTLEEILETIGMIKLDNFDIRTVTLGINLLRAVDKDPEKLIKNIERLIFEKAKDLVFKAEEAEKLYGIPIINKRITVTPISFVLEALLTGDKNKDLRLAFDLACGLDRITNKLKIDFLGGFGALVDKGMTYADQIVLESLPEVLSTTKRVCAFVNLASTRAGINMRAAVKMGSIIHKLSQKDNGALGCAKLVVFANAVSDNPFMAGGFHGLDQPDEVINIGISGPGVIARMIKDLPVDLPLDKLAGEIKNMAFKITRAGELIGREIALALGVKFGSIDLSLAPTTALGDSVALILERMGLEKAGTHGTTAALALLTDAVKKGGVMASSAVGGLSGAFIPLAEDSHLAASAASGCLTLDKLEALTAVCSVGLDMIAIPGDTRSTTIAAIIADEMAIGMINHKTTGVRLIPVTGKKAGDWVNFGGLFGKAPILAVHPEKSDQFVWRKGQLPAPITSLRN